MSGAWYWVPGSASCEKPLKLRHQSVVAGLRAALALSDAEARRHMAAHAAGLSPAIGLPNGGFYQWCKP